MAKKITKKVKEEVVVEKVEVKVEAQKVEVSRTPKGTAPVVTGKFYALAVEGGAVIINPNGQTVSKVMRIDLAERDAMRMNHH